MAYYNLQEHRTDNNKKYRTVAKQREYLATCNKKYKEVASLL
jgi:hypothetical protein